MNKWYLFIGRWQPFHEGHQYIIDSMLNQGKKVCIAVRDTPVNSDNPYRLSERVDQISKIYKDNPNVVVMGIPDIEAVCVGRDVGYMLLQAPDDIQLISATAKRKHHFCVWLTGLPSSGKTTLGKMLADYLREKNHPVEHLNGDILRSNISFDLGFDHQSRIEQGLRTITLADVLLKYTSVVVSLISPYQITRACAREKLDRFVEVYVSCPIEICEQRDTNGLFDLYRRGQITGVTGMDDHYHVPNNPEVIVETDRETIEESFQKIIDYLEESGLV